MTVESLEHMYARVCVAAYCSRTDSKWNYPQRSPFELTVVQQLAEGTAAHFAWYSPLKPRSRSLTCFVKRAGSTRIVKLPR